MVSILEGLIPALLWEIFFEISQIPRGSKNEERIRLYLRNFAEKNDLKINEDNVGNIVMQVKPTKGYEKGETVVLQSHIDMVCEKNKETVHDFNNDPIKLVRDGDWIKADGTTLGADNGIGAAAALAVAMDDSFNHGPIELLFTIDEETGLTGANNLQEGFIEGKYLLNLDTEEDGCFYVGCAGGMDTVGIFNIEFDELKKGYMPYDLFISGLRGGHSGINISDGRANAIKLLGLLLKDLRIVNSQISYLSGGSKRNAIPREAEALIWLNPNDEMKAREIINAFNIETALEYKLTDNEIKITFDKKENNRPVQKAFSNKFLFILVNTILSMPHGVISMSPSIPGLVETSTNLATVTVENSKLKIGTSQRSSVESAKKNIASSVKAVLDLANADVTVGDGYPGWQPNLESNLLKISQQVYKNLFDEESKIKAVHAGLECGILGDKYPGLDMISFGPTIEGAHSPDERVKIPDVEKFYDLLRVILAEIANMK